MKGKRVAILMGSKSDLEVMKQAEACLAELGVETETKVMSAHRKPAAVAAFAQEARANGFAVVIAGAGLAAHLPGVVAAHTDLPVVGVPLASGPLNGQDALYSVVQMPKGVPVATVGIGNAWNAGLIAAQILATADADLTERLKSYKASLAAK